MKKRTLFLLIVFLLTAQSALMAQDVRDSLLNLIDVNMDSADKAKIFCKVAEFDNNSDTIIKYSNLAMQYAKTDSTTISTALTYIAYVSYNEGNVKKSLEQYREAYEIGKNTSNDRLIAKIVLNTGCCLAELNDITGALENFKLAIELSKKCCDTSLTLWTYKELCDLCCESKLFNLANKYSIEAIQFAGNMVNNPQSIIVYYSTAEFLQWKTEMLQPNKISKQAMNYCDSIQLIADRTNTQESDLLILLHLSYVTKCRLFIQYATTDNAHQKQFIDSAQKYLSVAEKWFEDTGDSIMLLKSHLFNARILFLKGNYKAAIAEADKYPKEKVKESFYRTYMYRLYVDCYLKLGNYYEAFNYGRNIYDMANIDRQEAKLAQIAEKQISNRLDEFSLAETELKRQNELLTTRVNDKQSKLLLTFVVLCFSLITILITVVAVIRKRRANRLLNIKNKELMLQKEEIEQQQKVISTQKEKVERFNLLILKSIRYARYIQRTVLSSNEDIARLFPNSFLCYMPKDIVSGDFYYVTQCGKFNVFVVADCTGHGVPGGFLSMFGISAIKEILAHDSNDVIMPGKILDQMRSFVKEAFNCSTAYEGISDDANYEGNESFATADGMDMTICAINFETREMRFAGAYHSAYLWSKGNITRFAGDRMPIGRHINEIGSFNTTIQTLQPNDMLYMMTDGIQGQMGGISGTKFMTKRLIQFFLENATLPCANQKECFETVINNWMQHTIQVDDITLVGIRIE